MNAPSLGSVFAALAAAQAAQAVRSLAQRRNRHAGIHRTRKAIRKLRSLLALCRPGLGPKVKAIDKGLKRLGTSLSDLRDAHVVAMTASKLATGDQPECWLALAARLTARHELLLADALAEDPDFAARRKQLDELVQALAELPWEHLKDEHLGDGIARSAHRLAKAEQTAKREPDAANNHRWRRRLRRLRMQYQAIRAARQKAPSWAGPSRPDRYASMHHLVRSSDRLGWLQDLRMLEPFLKGTDASLPLALMRRRLRSEIKHAGPREPAGGQIPC